MGRLQLLNARNSVEDWTHKVHNVGLLFSVLIEAFKEVCLVIAPKQTLDLIDSTFGKLRDELLPVTMLDLQKASQIICLEKH